MRSYSKVMKDNFLTDLANMLTLRPIYRKPQNQKKVMTMNQLSLTRADVIQRAAQAAYNSETSDNVDVSMAWAKTTHAWIAVAKEMNGNGTSTVTVELDDIEDIEDAPSDEP